MIFIYPIFILGSYPSVEANLYTIKGNKKASSNIILETNNNPRYHSI